MTFRNAILLGLFFICFAAPLNARRERKQRTARSFCIQYDPADVNLAGKLVIETKFGPPGYGEDPKHDRKVRIYALRLSTPVCVQASGEYHTERGVRVIELFFRKKSGPTSWDAAHSAIGRRVRVTGRLRESMIGFEYTRVVMDVSRLLVGGSK